MAKNFSLADVSFRVTLGLVSGKPKRYFRTQYSAWVTEKTFVKQYQKIREKF